MMPCVASDVRRCVTPTVTAIRSTATFVEASSSIVRGKRWLVHHCGRRNNSRMYGRYLQNHRLECQGYSTLLLPRYALRRSLHSTTIVSDQNDNSGAKKHQLYLQQLQELEAERNSLFGSMMKDDDDDDESSKLSTSTTQSPDFPVSFINDRVDSTASLGISDSTVQNQSETAVVSVDPTTTNDDFYKSEREALYGFTSEERNAWSTVGGSRPDHSTRHAALLRDIHVARQQQQQQENDTEHQNNSSNVSIDAIGDATDATTSFSHLTSDQRQIHMVDVGSKVPTRRTATAQSLVTFPPQVLRALNPTGHPPPPQHSSSSSSSSAITEWIGPKGPIFATAITAGIMGVKQTSSLIPLCHPLPIENIHIDIHWYSSDTIQIQCTCSVTHKTGVEMEALMGCSIAALTIYDMVKAISHNVQITETKLLHKDGGKRHVDER